MAGKATGFVTTTRVTHASPAPIYANSADRDWEDSAKDGCSDIASQLVRSDVGKKLRVILGGGQQSFLPTNMSAITNGITTEPGKRVDNVDLIDEWLKDKRHRNVKGKYIQTAEELRKLDVDKVDHLFGMFAGSHMPYVLDLKDPKSVPSLAEMTSKAIQMLNKYNKNGYVLFVEGKFSNVAYCTCTN